MAEAPQRGRPPLHGARMGPGRYVRLPAELEQDVLALAAARGWTLVQVLRHALGIYLRGLRRQRAARRRRAEREL